MPDGASLPAFVWNSSSDGAPRAVFIGIHGLGANGTVFELPASRFAQLGITTYGYDQRGFGDATGRGSWPGTAALIDDLNGVAELVRQRHPNLPLYLYGTSMGGGVILAAAGAGKLPPVDGVLLLAPAVLGWRSLGLASEMLLRVTASIAPGARYKRWRDTLRMMSDNAELTSAVLQDPDVNAGMKLEIIKGIVDLGTKAAEGGTALTVATLLLYGRKDMQVPLEPTLKLARDIAGPKRVLFYAKGYHALDYDLQRENVFRDVDAWLTDRSAPLPSVTASPPAAEEIAT